jgi:hypothetical protein
VEQKAWRAQTDHKSAGDVSSLSAFIDASSALRTRHSLLREKTMKTEQERRTNQTNIKGSNVSRNPPRVRAGTVFGSFLLDKIRAFLDLDNTLKPSLEAIGL